MPVQLSNHPLVQHHLSELRDKSTSSAAFRTAAGRLTNLLAYEAAADLPTQDATVETPLCAAQASRIGASIGLFPILRAGLGMTEPFLHLMPEAEVWHLGMYRDEATATPVEYYQKLPATGPVDVAFVLDPMLATGGSANLAIATLQQWGVTTIKLCSLIAAKPGIDAVLQRHPQVSIHACVCDPQLNDQSFIVPGLGDAGDRIFNTQRD